MRIIEQGVPDGTEALFSKARKCESAISGEPDALKGASPVREGIVGNVSQGNVLAVYFTQGVAGSSPARRVCLLLFVTYRYIYFV